MNFRARSFRGIVLLALAFALTFAAGGQGSGAQASLTAYFFDVGQGDATLFLGEDFTILVDAGRHDRKDVVPHLERVGVRTIDLVIGTHPHSDHIGQCPDVIESFEVREVWLSGDTHTTRTFERCLDAILASDAGYYEPRAGDVFHIGSALIEVVHPRTVTGDLNNGSIGVKISYGEVEFLLTGDAEIEAERAILARPIDVRADILQLGHHEFVHFIFFDVLKAVQPDIAIYSAGADNPYGHPHDEVLVRLRHLEIPVYGTDVHGTIRVVTDGRTYRIETARNGAVASPNAAWPPQANSGCLPGQINVNSAPTQALEAIVHIGPTLAERVVAGRPYGVVDDLIRVDGIGDGRLRDIKAEGLACAA